MQLAKFGHTGLTVSRLCPGTATFGKQTDEAESHRILDVAADAGINLLDTADFYPMGAAHAQLGCTEEITGRWLKGKPRNNEGRNKLQIPFIERLTEAG